MFLLWRCSKGMALASLDRSQEALHAYEQALRLRPDYPEAWVNKAALFGRLGAHQEALDACKEALRLQPDDSMAWRNKGVALLGLEDSKGALDAFDQSLRLQSADSKVLWGKVYWAKTCCTRARARGPHVYPRGTHTPRSAVPAAGT